jgi:hypothetical protein
LDLLFLIETGWVDKDIIHVTNLTSSTCVCGYGQQLTWYLHSGSGSLLEVPSDWLHGDVISLAGSPAKQPSHGQCLIPFISVPAPVWLQPQHISLSRDADGLGHSEYVPQLAAPLISPFPRPQLNQRIPQRSSSGAFDIASRPHFSKHKRLGQNPSCIAHIPCAPQGRQRLLRFRYLRMVDPVRLMGPASLTACEQNPPPPPSSTKSGRLFGRGGLGEPRPSLSTRHDSNVWARDSCVDINSWIRTCATAQCRRRLRP